MILRTAFALALAGLVGCQGAPVALPPSGPPASEASLPPNAVVHEREAAPFDGILVPGPRYARQLALAVEGQKAREGAYAAPAWQRWTTTVGTILVTALVVWREVRGR